MTDNTDEKSKPSGFESSASRVIGELDERLANAARALGYHNGFLDDVLRGILPHDLILIGAPSGVGKTDLALQIAINNVANKKRVAYFALEAEPRELERRTKFGMLCSQLYREGNASAGAMNFADWQMGRLEDVCGHLNAAADRMFLSKLGGMQTFYRGSHFDQNDLREAIIGIHERVDLIVVDHLHYIDSDDDNEARGLGDVVKAVRDVVLRIGKPVILVAHLRKRDPRGKQLVATLDDFHGSSNVAKIATHAISLDRAYNVEPSKWWLSPTFMTILKDRRGGETGHCALAQYNKKTRSYESSYSLGRLVKMGTEWEQVKVGDAPTWAKHHQHMEMDS